MPSDLVALIGRIALAVIFIASGASKLMSPEQTQQYMASAGLPMVSLLYWVTLAVEILGGLMLVFGAFARFAGLVLAAFSAAAAVIFHNNFADQNQMIHFLKDIAIAGGLLQVAAFGAGRYALTSD